jgi:diguanylate cyclase (GGDEF)-like protein
MRRRIAAEQQARELAFQDPLTGLANRRQFDAALREAIASPPRAGGAHALFLLDLNGFKQVNDVHGHQEGDSVLTAFAAALLRCVRRTDVVGRLSGDEFVVLVTGMDEVRSDAAVVARKILAAAGACSNASTPVSASIGIALYESDTRPEDLMKRSDVAMYGAKQSGKNRFVFHCDLKAGDR